MNLKSLIGKLNDSTRGALEAAAGLCLARTHYDIEVEHYLTKLLDSTDNDAAAIFKHFEVDTSRLSGELARALDKLKTGNARTPALSPTLMKMLIEAWTIGSIDYNAGQVRTGFTILALATNDELVRLMREVSREFQKIQATYAAQGLCRDCRRFQPRKHRQPSPQPRRARLLPARVPAARLPTSTSSRSISRKKQRPAKSIRCWGAISKFAR